MLKNRFSLVFARLSVLSMFLVGALASEPCEPSEILAPQPPGMIEVDLDLVEGSPGQTPLFEWTRIEKLREYYKNYTVTRAPCSILEGEAVKLRLFFDLKSAALQTPPESFSADAAFQFYGYSRLRVERSDRETTRVHAFPLAGSARIAEVAEAEQLELLLEDLSQLQIVSVPRFHLHSKDADELCFRVSQVSAVPTRVFAEEPASDPSGSSLPYVALNARRMALEYLTREAKWLQRIGSEKPGCHAGDTAGYWGRQVRSWNMNVQQIAPEIDYVDESMRFWKDMEERIEILRKKDGSWKSGVSGESNALHPPHPGSYGVEGAEPVHRWLEKQKSQIDELQGVLRYYLKLKSSLPEDEQAIRRIAELEARLGSSNLPRERRQEKEFFRWLATRLFISGDIISAEAYLTKALAVDPFDEQALMLREKLNVLAGHAEKLLEFPGGAVRVGAALGQARFYNQIPQFATEMAAFRIDSEPVSAVEFERFAHDAHGSSSAAPEEEMPVVGVTFEEAMEYCRSRRMRLPSEFEWEIAAGLEQFQIREGTSEWTASWYQPYPGNDRAEPEYGELFRVVRGFDDRGALDPHLRFFMAPVERSPEVGFRCAADNPKKALASAGKHIP